MIANLMKTCLMIAFLSSAFIVVSVSHSLEAQVVEGGTDPALPVPVGLTNLYCPASCKARCSTATWNEPVYPGTHCGQKVVGGGCNGCGNKWW
jgi:hypothetical protein